MQLKAVFVVLNCVLGSLMLHVLSVENDFSEGFQFSGVPVIAEDAFLLNEIFQPSFEQIDWLSMPYDVQDLMEKHDGFAIKIMDSSWTGLANTNVFHKGEKLHVVVSAFPDPGQQLYVQSCHASSSPNPADKPKISFIINNGCVGSRDSLVKFVFHQNDQVGLLLNASVLELSNVYLHCRILLSKSGLTSNTKFCNYNKIKSRWVDLSGETSVCECCRRSCKSLSELWEPNDLSVGVTTGPVVIQDQISEPQPTPLALADMTTTKNQSGDRMIMAGASLSGSSVKTMANISPWPAQSSSGGVMIINQEPGGALSMWLPEPLQFNLNPDVQFAFPDYSMTLDVAQSDEPFKNVKAVEKDLHDILKENNGMLSKDANLNFQGAFGVTRNTLEQTSPSLYQSSASSLELTSPPTANTASEDTRGEFVFRQAEMIFKKAKGDKSSKAIEYSKLRLHQASDGSSSLTYEEKRHRVRSDHINATKLKIKPKHEHLEENFGLLDLISSLFNSLRNLWTKK